jgi:hypothetical protein
MILYLVSTQILQAFLIPPISPDQLLQAFDPKLLGDGRWCLLTAQKFDEKRKLIHIMDLGLLERDQKFKNFNHEFSTHKFIKPN